MSFEDMVFEEMNGHPVEEDKIFVRGYNKALEDLQERIDEEYYDGGYGDYHEVDMIVRMIEQMKEGK